MADETKLPDAQQKDSGEPATTSAEDITADLSEQTSGVKDNSNSTSPASGDQTAAQAATAAVKPYPARVVPMSEEPYDYEKSTLLVSMYIMPVDGHADGREVVLSIATHTDIPIMRLVRMKELEPLPPWLESLLSAMKDAMPSYGEDAERRKEEEKAIRRAATTKTTTTNTKKLKSTAGQAGTGKTAIPDATNDASGAVVTNEQTSLFDLAAGSAAQPITTASAGGGQ